MQDETQTQKADSATAEASALPIRAFSFDGRKYGIVFGESKFIVTNTEFIHAIYANNEDATLNSGYPNHREESFMVGDLYTLSTDDMNLASFGHYWGIKDRMARNYSLLLKSMKEIGVDTKDMPEFSI